MNQGVELIWLSGNSTREATADGSIVAGLTPHLLAFLFNLNTVVYGHLISRLMSYLVMNTFHTSESRLWRLRLRERDRSCIVTFPLYSSYH